MQHETCKDELLIKTLRMLTVDNMIIEFPARKWKWQMLFDLVQRTDSTDNAKG